MANRRVLVKRRKAVRNIRKITRTMELIATARFKAAIDRAVASRPYTEKLAELVADLSRAAGEVDHPLLRTNEGVGRSALVVLTSDRGLAGGYNANILRTATGHLDQQVAGMATDVHMVGKKGIAYFRFLRRPVAEQTSGIDDRPRFDQVEPIANALIDRFVRGEIASAHVAYMKFLSAGQQRPVVVQLLPLSRRARRRGRTKKKPVRVRVLARPRSTPRRAGAGHRSRCGSSRLPRRRGQRADRPHGGDEGGDRRTPQDMIKALTREYNRARQTQITRELLDIMGGANALS